VASGFRILSVRKVLENGHFLGIFLKIKNLANTSVYKAFRVARSTEKDITGFLKNPLVTRLFRTFFIFSCSM